MDSSSGYYTAKYSAEYNKHLACLDDVLTARPTHQELEKDSKGNKLRDEHNKPIKKEVEDPSLRERRNNAPLWNTIREVFWLSGIGFAQTARITGQFIGYTVTAVFALPLGTGLGIGVATVMTTCQHLGLVKEPKSFDNWVIKTAQVVCHGFFNRVTEGVCTAFGGLVVSAVLQVVPFLPLVLLATSVFASPFIYTAFRNNYFTWIEELDKFLMSDFRTWTHKQVWGPFMDFTGKDLRERVIKPVCQAFQSIIDETAPQFLSENVRLFATP